MLLESRIASRARGIVVTPRVLCVVNGKPSSCTLLAETIGLPSEVELLADEAGDAGRAFGVCRGWKPDDGSLSPYAKLFGMLVGLGAWRTLPSVISALGLACVTRRPLDAAYPGSRSA